MLKHLSEQWQFTREYAEDSWKAVPEDTQQFTLNQDGFIDLDSMLEAQGKEGDDAMVYNRFTVGEDTDIALGASCDWWFEVWLNGAKLYSTFPGGNLTSCFTAGDHLFLGKVVKGENLLAIHVRRGAKSWAFAMTEADLATADPCTPLTMEADISRIIGPIKPMNAVNNGPVRARSSQSRGNFDDWVAAKIPFARNHDAAFCATYGGEHCVDMNAVFPDFNADPEDPASYDFDLTDDYLRTTLDAGTQIFYRFGSKIEHLRKKYGTKVPTDFKKWAVICEHIIRHYNEGWANGFQWNITYWEIWNEPDLDKDDSPNKRTWQGTEKQFYELYKVAALHLKACFPSLKIGGPALSGQMPWMRRFLKAMGEANVPIDFFSWHIYSTQPRAVYTTMLQVRKALDENGYTATESILNEWNYVRSWNVGFTDTVRTIIGLKGAVYTSAVMSTGQNGPVDMLMYYDARPCAFNGLFDFYTFTPFKTYYTFLAWAKLAELGHQFTVDTHDKNGVFAVGATDGNGKASILITRYFEQDDLPEDLDITINLPGVDTSRANMLLLDETHDLSETTFRRSENAIGITMKANTLVVIEL